VNILLACKESVNSHKSNRIKPKFPRTPSITYINNWLLVRNVNTVYRRRSRFSELLHCSTDLHASRPVCVPGQLRKPFYQQDYIVQSRVYSFHIVTHFTAILGFRVTICSFTEQDFPLKNKPASATAVKNLSKWWLKTTTTLLNAVVTNTAPTPISSDRINVDYRNRTVQRIRTEGTKILNRYRSTYKQFVTGSSNQVSK
jgi:hypothetical protein